MPHTILKALANKHRLKIVKHLIADGEMNVSSINKHVKISQPAISQHLNKLNRAKIIKRRREQRHIFYSIADQRVVRVLELLEGNV